MIQAAIKPAYLYDWQHGDGWTVMMQGIGNDIKYRHALHKMCHHASNYGQHSPNVQSKHGQSDGDSSFMIHATMMIEFIILKLFLSKLITNEFYYKWEY